MTRVTLMKKLTFSPLSPWLTWSAVLPFWSRFARRPHRPSHTLQTLNIMSSCHHVIMSSCHHVIMSSKVRCQQLSSHDADLDAAHPREPRWSLRPGLSPGSRVPRLSLDDQHLT